MAKKDYPSYPIVQIGGIDAAGAEKLRAMRIRTTARLLEAAKSPKGRKLLAQRTGISASLLLRWANKADLMRVKGIGDDYTTLLQAVGVGTIRKLRAEKPAQLAKRMAKINETKEKGIVVARIVRVVPSERSIQRWVARAREMPLRITY